jgi:hypothetical protein
MASISNIGTAWTTIGAPTAANEIWQCKAGSVEITAEAVPGPNDGIRLNIGQGCPISAGKTISYRRVSESAAVIQREAL